MKRTRIEQRWDAAGHAALGLLAAAMLIGGCSASSNRGEDPRTDTMTMAEMRLNEAGGPAPAAKPVGLVSPVASPDQATLAPEALTDAGPNTPLGKEWAFTMVDGYDDPLPGPPNNAGFLMSRGNGRLIGNTSCNSLTATFEISIAAGTLKYSNVVNGSGLCSRSNSDTEEAVIAVMLATDGFRLDGKKLTLLSKDRVIAELITP